MKKNLEKLIAGILIPSVLLPSCTLNDYFIDNDVVSINNAMMRDHRNSVAVPINMDIGSKDLRIINFTVKLTQDIIKNPLIAKQFAEDPQSIAEAYGISDVKLDFDDGLWQLFMALSDDDIHNAAVTNNIPLFFSLCEQRGLITGLQDSELVKCQKLLISDDEEITTLSGVMAAGVVVFVVAGGGCAVVGANSAAAWDQYALWTKEYFWNSENQMSKRDPIAFQVWMLKNETNSTQIFMTEYQEKIVDECVEALQEYFPEKIENINTIKLKQFIYLNFFK